MKKRKVSISGFWLGKLSRPGPFTETRDSDGGLKSKLCGFAFGERGQRNFRPSVLDILNLEYQ